MGCLRLTLTSWRRRICRRGCGALYPLQSPQSWWTEKEVLEKNWASLPKTWCFCWFQMNSPRFGTLWSQPPVFNSIDPAFKDFVLILSSATQDLLILLGPKFLQLLKIPSFVWLSKKRQLANNQHEILSAWVLATKLYCRDLI